MDPDDCDQTQAIALDDDYNDDTDDLEPDGDKKPVGFLKVLLQKGLNETSHPIYEGDNIIGRSKDTCHVFIQSKSLSKEHACIQVVGDVHMIFDKGSRNKTRRGKLLLSPDVRYELKNNEEVMFADVKCVYQIAYKVDTVAESGSETDGSESLMLKYDITDETSIGKRDDSKNNNDDSVLPPTQSFAQDPSKSKVIVNDTPDSSKKGSRSQVTEVPMPTLVLSESECSDEEEDNKAPGMKSTNQTSQTCKKIQDTLLCEDSDPESSRDKYQFGAATQAYGMDHDDESSRHSLIGAATQAYGPTRDDSDEDVESDKKIMCEPTQAFVKNDHVTESLREKIGTASNKKEGKTLTQGQDEQNVSKEMSASDSSAAATQVFEEEEEDDDFNGTGLFAAATMACDDVVEEEDETEDEGDDNESDPLGPDVATQVFDAEAPTQKMTTQGKKQSQADTIAVGNSSYTSTMPIQSTIKSQMPSRKKSPGCSAKGIVSTSDLPTQVILSEEETLPIKEIAGEDGEEAETQVFVEETVAVEEVIKTRRGKQIQAKAMKETELKTQPVGSHRNHTRTSNRKKTSAKNINPTTDTFLDTLVIGEDENCNEEERDAPTQLFDPDNGQGRVTDLENATDGPTQDFANSSSELPTQVFSPDDIADSPEKGKKKKLIAEEKKDVEVIFSENDSEEDDAGEKPWLAIAANEPTQVFNSNEEVMKGKTPISKNAIINKSNLVLSDENNDGPETVSFENEATQAYGVFEEDEVDDVIAYDTEKKAVGAEEPTQAYCLVAEESSDEDDPDVVRKADEPTQAYELQPDDGDADATQPFDNDVEEEDDQVIQGDAVNQSPKEKSDVAENEVPKLNQQTKREETIEDSGDDSDLEEMSVLQMDQVAEALAETPQISPLETDDKKAAQETPKKEKSTSDTASVSAEPPLSPVIPNKSNESTPVFAVFADKKDLSDTEEMVPDSMANSDGEEKADTESNPIIPLPLPNKSPLKSALADRRRSPSPAGKRVNFTEPELSSSTEMIEETDSGRRRGRSTVTKVEKSVPRGRLTRKNQIDVQEISSKVQVKKNEVVEAIESQQETKNSFAPQSARENIESYGSNKEDVVKEEVIQEKPEESSESVKADSKSKTSRGRKRKENEDSQKTVDENESNSVTANLSKTVDSKKPEQTFNLEEGVRNVDERESNITKGLPRKKGNSSKNADLTANSLINDNKEKSVEKLKNISSAAESKASNSDKGDQNLTSTPEGRTSSRGRKITSSNHLKDYDTSTKPRGRVSRSSIRSSSPAVNAKSSGDTAQDTENSDTSLQSSAVSTDVLCNAPKQTQSLVIHKDPASSELDQSTVSKSDTGRSRRGTRRKADVEATEKVDEKESSDGPIVLAGDSKTDTDKAEKETNIDETKASTPRKGVKSRGQGSKSLVTNATNNVEEGTAEKDMVRKPTNESESSVANEKAVKTSPKKIRGQVSMYEVDKSKTEEVEGNNLSLKESAKIEEKHEIIKTTETPPIPRTRGKKSRQSVKNQTGAKKIKLDMEDSEKAVEIEKASEETSGKRRGRSKVPEKQDEQQQQILASAGTEVDISDTKGKNSRRGQPIKAADSCRTEEKKSFDNKKTVDKEETEKASSTASTRRGRDRRSVAAMSNLTHKEEVESSNEHCKELPEQNQNATSRISIRQKSKAEDAGEETKGQGKLSTSTPDATEKPYHSSQSSIGSRGRRGAKRSILSQESLSQKSSQSQEGSSAKESQLLQDKKQTGTNSNSKKANNDVQKEASKTQSQPSPSPSKKPRRSSPPPSTPSRKGVAAVASPVSSPSLRKSTLNHQPKVMFTGVIDDLGEKVVKELGVELVNNIQECTHLITDKIRRTVKFLGGLAKGALIVTPQWLESCKRARTFLDGNKFLVCDPAMEKQYRFSLQSSIERASSVRLLEGYSVHVTPSVKPDPTQMKDILLCAGAKFLSSMPGKSQPNTVVISCPEDQALWAGAVKAGVPVMGAEFILTGLLRQELQPQVFSLTKTDTPQTGKGRGRHK